MSAIDPQKALKNNSTTAFLTALAVNGGLLLLEVGAFLVLKQRLWRIYSPRTVLPPPNKRAEELPSGPWKWIPALLTSPAEDIIHKNGLDAYMFLRFIRLLLIIFLVFTISTFLIIVPVNAAFIPAISKGLDQISWSNITEPKNQLRFTAHVIVVYLLTAFVIYLIQREMLHYTYMRHQFLISKSHSRLAQARTVLVTPVPDELANERDLRLFASFVPGGIDKIWMYRDTTALNALFEKREEACKKLEAAEARILRIATLAWREKEKIYSRKLKDEERTKAVHKLVIPQINSNILDELVAPNLRPKHRTGFLGLFGLKVDTIEWCKMDNKWMEAHPKDIVWRNLDDGALEMKSRYITSWLATVGLIIAWAFPVGFIGTLSNLSDLCEKVRWLRWVCEAPPVARGLVEGVLPPLLLAILFVLLPFILRGLAWYECIPRYSLISVSVYRRFYLFLLIHGFLIVTLSSGITNVTQGLAGAGSALVQLVPLVMHYLRKWFLGRTPRQAYEVTFQMPSADFGVILPRLSLLATITFAYSVLSPLINLLALISYGMFYLAWKFLLTQVFDQPDEKETGGLYFPMAINNLFVGLYIEQTCLACLFFLRASSAGVTAVIQGVFMVALIVLTALAHALIHYSFSPLKQYLPMSLATSQMAKRYSKHDGPLHDEDGEIDLFSRHRMHSVRRRIQNTTKKLDGKLDQLKAKIQGEDGQGPSSKEGVNDSKLSSHDTEPIAETTAISSSSSNDLPELSRKKSSDSGVSKQSKKELTKRQVFDAAAPAVEDSDSSDEDDEDDHAFDHPSTYADQAWIWIPKDTLGLSEYLSKELKDAGVYASDVGANMDERGVVEVTRNPPDEVWGGGHDL
ncbi:hypothetical protein GALMADRAFT_226985 [Galerina marginata CBS 339.88]|uniref:CSC1/OSCA1-like 7TM region domain-containing protein n=1 Tax=Galerina marginata (strain CBS 339.88) TaxID=685588 RepID=A0A067T8J4_GALM3|nr:hypothetical protein GALMADRAFT_226985 [Galerina marginata CBS 339.88]